jgi:hypothetical protein
MRSNRYLHIAIIWAMILFLVPWQTAVAGPPEKPGNHGVPGLLAEISELNAALAIKQETIDQHLQRIEELEAILQNFAPVPQTGQSVSYYEGDDGDLQLGVPWPEPRFTDNGDGTVKDRLTRLVWLKNANCFGPIDWYAAMDAANNLADGQCGLADSSVPGDWHLPNVREILSLVDYDRWGPALPSGQPFTGVQTTGVQGYYWSSTTPPPNSDGAEVVSMHASTVFNEWKGVGLSVWAVRSDY